MTNYFDLIYCKIYQWVKRNRADDVPEFTALCLYGMLITFNLLSLFGYVFYFVKGEAIAEFSRMYALLLVLAVLAILYAYFIRGKRYIATYKKYEGTILYQTRIALVVIFYIVATIVAFIGLARL